MKTLLISLIGLAALSTTASAQKMGRANRNAPSITQKISFGERGTVELGYSSITWSSGRWAEALASEQSRGPMRDRINQSAESTPLGWLETSVDLKVAGKKLAAGRYDLAFMLDDRFQWEMVLSGDAGKVSLPVALSKSPRRSSRLILSLQAGDEDFTGAIGLRFGEQVGRMELVPGEAEEQAAAAVNTVCPFMGEPVDLTVTVQHRGQRVAFCCEECIESWNELNGNEKDQMFAKMVARKSTR